MALFHIIREGRILVLNWFAAETEMRLTMRRKHFQLEFSPYATYFFHHCFEQRWRNIPEKETATKNDATYDKRFQEVPFHHKIRQPELYIAQFHDLFHGEKLVDKFARRILIYSMH